MTRFLVVMAQCATVLLARLAKGLITRCAAKRTGFARLGDPRRPLTAQVRSKRARMHGLVWLATLAPTWASAAGQTPNGASAPNDLPAYAQSDPGGIPGLEPGGEEGAFRMVCGPTHMNWDDAIIAPGVKGGSSHLHGYYGSPAADYASTYDSLEVADEGTCGGLGNKSAYWAPALLNAKGKVIQPDYILLYYKRLPIHDARCVQHATKGCAPLPQGLRVVQGYDMRRMGQVQEGIGVTHRCLAPGRPSEHRNSLAEALSDCGGSGQIMARVIFGDCWNGQIDSKDHRSHLAYQRYGDDGRPRCPAKHPWLIPQQTQQIAYTVERSDGTVHHSCDMAGVPTCFHADYMERWMPVVRERWEKKCLDELRSCSAGQLGDGTILKQRQPPTLASPRLLDQPARNSNEHVLVVASGRVGA